jgi:hypothetical protein
MSAPALYTPLIPRRDWAVLSPFVLGVVADVREDLTYPEKALLHTITHHAHWTHLVAGFTLDRSIVFKRDVIAYSVSMIPTRSPSTMGRARSMLLRVGEVLGAIDVPAPLPRLRAADPSAPYSPADLEELRAWAYCQRNAHLQASAQVLLALGLGAGLPTRELARVRSVDVDTDAGRLLVNDGEYPRSVRVQPEWLDDLREVIAAATDPQATLFRPAARFHKNIVTNFVRRTNGTSLAPTTQRMRATWLVDRLTTGIPMQDLLFEAGLSSMDALVRYERFLPAHSLESWRGR